MDSCCVASSFVEQICMIICVLLSNCWRAVARTTLLVRPQLLLAVNNVQSPSHMQSCNEVLCTTRARPGRLVYNDCPLVCGSSEIDQLLKLLLHSPLPFETFLVKLSYCGMPAYAAAHKMICMLMCSNLVTAATTPGDVQSTVQFSPAASLGSGDGAASPTAAAAGEPHMIRLCANTLPELCSDTGEPSAGNYGAC